MNSVKFPSIAILSTLSMVFLAACSGDSASAPEETGDIISQDLSSDSVLPGSSASVIPESSGTAIPGSSTTAMPGSSTNTVPGSSTSVLPGSSTTVSPTSSTEIETDNENATVITYTSNGASVANNNNCVEVNGGEVVITCAGDYDFSGNYSGADAQIRVYSPKADSGVYLNLRGLTLANSVDAPIYVQMASKAFVVAKRGSENTLSDGSSRTKTFNYVNGSGQAKTDTTSACIYAKDDLTIKGEGTLVVKGNYNNGIHTANDLRFRGETTVQITAKNNGVKGKGLVDIEKGNITVTSTGGDGIKSDADEAADLANGKGSITITGGTVTVNAAMDGLTANNTVTIGKGEQGEPTIKITSGGGQTCLGNSTGGQGGGQGGRGGPGGRGGFGGFGGGNSCSPDSSMKGIKADSSIIIEAGKIDINSHDDGIHSDGSITISGGFTTVKSDDDGVHSEKTLTIKDGTVEVTMAYEGMEAAYMNFEGGITSVFTTNDAWNAAGANASSSTGGQGGRGGFAGGGGFGSSDGSKAKVTGGFHYLYVGTGDTDGMDSNGDIEMTGGVVIIECRMNGGMGGMVDSDGNTSITGGKLLGFGTNNSEEGTQYNVNFTAEKYYGTSEIAFKPSFSGSKMVSNVGQPSEVSNVSGMTKTCFGNSETNCVYTK